MAGAETDLIRGVWTWGRGGGWQGPYITGGGNGAGGSDGGGAAGEFWEDLNVYVVSQWVAARLSAGSAAGLDELPDEAAVFEKYCADVLGLNGTESCDVLRSIALQSADAVLQMHYCQQYDTQLQPDAGGKGGIPTNNWMRCEFSSNSRQQ